MTRQKPYYDEGTNKEFNTIYGAGTRTLSVIDTETGEVIQDLIETRRPRDTKKKNRRKYDQYAVMVFDKVTNAIVSGAIEGYEIIVLMAAISRISFQDEWVVDENGVKLSILGFTKAANLDRNTTTETLKSLEEKGFIIVEKFNGKASGIRVMKSTAWRGNI